MRVFLSLGLLTALLVAGCAGPAPPPAGAVAGVTTAPESLGNTTLDRSSASAAVAVEPIPGAGFQIVVNAPGAATWHFLPANASRAPGWHLAGTTPAAGVYAFEAPPFAEAGTVNLSWTMAGGAGAQGNLRFDVWGVPLQFGAEPTAEQVIRPGIYSEVCTTNFIFHYKWYRLFIGTAAHCASSGRGDGCMSSQMEYGTPETLEHGIQVTHGWSSWNLMNEVKKCHGGNDFALFEIAQEDWAKVHPKGHGIIGHVTGLGDCRKLEPSPAMGGSSTDIELEAYGRSSLRSPGVRSTPDDPRNDKIGEFLQVDSEDFQCYVMYHSPGIPGDSGGPLATQDGLALGAASTVSVVPIPASNHYTNIAAALDFMREHQGWAPEVVTSA